ncbi:hypothetical protein Bca52824_072524 [Brassica carinata]|uniref:Transmembrane protein n=2 Tax=Brassica TaxID=3705 RepID=A0A8S9MZB8_BRACR|nr:hypothetical protein F2Q69_00054414 [Brassica cretica]KAG2265445.1 hypothetical protein Bca52824_072524 [Brassica carinata]
MKMDKKLSVFELLKRAVKLLLSNINLALIVFLCSLPLFCFLIFFELSLQTTLSFTYQFLSKQVNVEKDLPENDLFLQTTTNYLTYQSLYQQRNIWEDLSENDLIPWLIKTSLLYFFPYTNLDLLTTTTIVAASSTVYMSKEEPLGLIDLVHRSIKICQKRLGGCLVTSLYVLLLSTSVFLFFLPFFLLSFFGVFSHWAEKLNFVGIIHQPQTFLDLVPFLIYAMVVLVQATLFMYLTAKFIKWSAGWNMSLVFSVLEEEGEDGEEGVSGSNALSLSAWYRKGHETRDVWMMLMFLVFALTTRMPCLYSKCSLSSSGNGVLYTGLYVGLICVGNVVKWLACVVRYHDCKTRPLRKKADVEQAKPPATQESFAARDPSKGSSL